MATINDFKGLQEGDKVLFTSDGTVYDFGYISETGHVVCYSEGERNMQDSIAIEPEYLAIIQQKGN